MNDVASQKPRSMDESSHELTGHRYAVVVLGASDTQSSPVSETLELAGLRIPSVAGQDSSLHGILDELNSRLGQNTTFRPHGWIESQPALQARTRLVQYFSDSTDPTTPPLAVRSPLLPLYLPLIRAAAESVGVSLDFIWIIDRLDPATGLSGSSTSHAVSIDSLVLARQNYYILRDSPDSTLLLPIQQIDNNPDQAAAAIGRVASRNQECHQHINLSRELPERTGGRPAAPFPICASIDKYLEEHPTKTVHLSNVRSLAAQAELATILSGASAYFSEYVHLCDQHVLPEDEPSAIRLESLAQRVSDANAQAELIDIANLLRNKYLERSDGLGLARDDNFRVTIDGLKTLAVTLESELSRVSRERQEALALLEHQRSETRSLREKVESAECVAQELLNTTAAYADLTTAYDALEEATHAYQNSIDRLKTELAQSDEALRDSELRLAQLGHMTGEASQALAPRLDEASPEAATREQEHLEELGRLRAELDSLLSSPSWRITAPLRTIKALIQR